MNLTLFISPRRVALILTFVVIFLSLVSLAGQFSSNVLGHGKVFGLVRLFNVGLDSNLPTWYSSFTLLLCSLLLAVIARAKKINRARYVLHWQVLSAIFLYLSIDEVAMLHEQVDRVLGLNFSRTNFLYYSWVAVGIPLLFVFVLAYLKFLAHLPKKTRLLFFLAGAIFVGGGISAEMFAGRIDYLYGSENMTHATITTLEEFLEMFGVVVFIFALLSYMSSNLKEMRFWIKQSVRPKLGVIEDAVLEQYSQKISKN